jgi:uncharacterized cupredoxin-like copper-binding protein
VTRARLTPRLIAALVAAVVLLAGASTVAVAAAGGAFRSAGTAPNAQCSAPGLAGTVVDVRLLDMGGRMLMGGSDGGMMRELTSRATVSAGTASFRAANTGTLVHELVVLPLAGGRRVGTRAIGANGRVNETASIGEASRTCGGGVGEGIDPGTIGWVTLHLAPGDYELICNLPGHYAAGMYTSLHVA